MKKITALIVLSLTLMISSVHAAVGVDVFTPDSEKCTKTGDWALGDQIGYANQTVLTSANGTVSWKIGEGSGIFRLMYWVTIDEGAASDGKFTIDSEFTKTAQTIDFSDGKSGWRDMGFADCGNIGMTVSIRSDSGGRVHAGALRAERLGGRFAPLVSFAKSNANHIIFGLNTKNAYVDGKAMQLKRLPKKADGEVYISKQDLINTGYGASVSDECITSFEGDDYVNISKFAQISGKSIFVSEDGLVLLSDQKIDFNQNIDRLKLRNIYTALKFGNE